MSADTYLLWANVVVWLGIAGYLVFLGAKSAQLSQRLNQLELLRHDHTSR